MAAEWNYEKNYPLKPSDVTYASGKKVWWILLYHDKRQNKNFNFEWQATVNSRTIGKQNCPYLSGHQVYPGFNDLESQYPELAKEWNYEKNAPLTPNKVGYGSGKKVWWVLPYDDPETGKHFNFEWQASINSRTSNGVGCPYLFGKLVYPGFNDLETLHPGIAREWDYEKNYPLLPSEVPPGSHEEVYWKCRACGHEWQASPNRRFFSSGCPECAKYFSSSFPEAVTYFYVKKYFPDTIWIHRSFGFELDIYIPSLQTGIEYDGKLWHRNKQEKDKEKNQKCLDNNITLWRIRESIPSLDDTSYDILISGRYNLNKLNAALNQLFKEAFNINADIDIFRDYDEIQELYVTHNTKRSLQTVYPELLLFFDYSKNKRTPIHIAASSVNHYFWINPVTGESFEATIRVMLSKIKKDK